jgi:hypothetical protein
MRAPDESCAIKFQRKGAESVAGIPPIPSGKIDRGFFVISSGAVVAHQIVLPSINRPKHLITRQRHVFQSILNG